MVFDLNLIPNFKRWNSNSLCLCTGVVNITFKDSKNAGEQIVLEGYYTGK